MEFLVKFHISFPPMVPQSAMERVYAEEAQAAKPYFESGVFKRVWRIPGTRDHWALWEAPDADTVHQAYASFPMYRYGYGVVTEFYALAINPNDPGPDGDQGLLADTSLDNYHGPALTWVALNNWLLANGGPGDASHGEGLSAVLHEPGNVSIHNHPGAGRSQQIHFMVDGQKIAEIGPPIGHGEEVEPGYIDLLVEWEGNPVNHDGWKARIMRDNGLSRNQARTVIQRPGAGVH